MGGYINIVALMGDVSEAPDEAFTKNGKRYVKFEITTKDDRGYESKARVAVFGKGAESAGEIRLGDKVAVQGAMSYGECKAFHVGVVQRSGAPAPSQGQMFGQGNDGRATDPFGGDDIPF